MNSETNFIKIDKEQCFYEDEDTGIRCENITSYGLEMPFDFPPMPLCRIHAYDFHDWTMDDTLRELATVMTEEDFFAEFMEDYNDNS